MYFLIGIILVVMNLLVDIVQFVEDKELPENASYSIGYFIGPHIFLIFGLILLRMGYKHHRKILRQQENLETKEQIDSIGKL